MVDSDPDEYEIPLRDQRYFGAGIKRKRIQFVPSGSETPSTTSLQSTPTISAADKYLSIVLKKSETPIEQDVTPTKSTLSIPSKNEDTSDPPTISAVKHPVLEARADSTERQQSDGQVQELEKQDDEIVCGICDRPIRASALAAHESTIAHQVRLQHSYPPSHLDRARKGLAVLQTHGWDPDARRGLGAEGEGVLHPIKATANPERRGIGAELVERVPVAKSVLTVDAGKVRLLDVKGKKKAESLRNAFYRSEEVERYLGEQEDSGGQGLDLDAFKRSKRGR